MSIKQTILRPHIQKIVDDIDTQISYHKELIKNLELSKQAYIKFQPYEVKTMMHNSPLTRGLIRNFLKGYIYPVQTVQVIDLLYSSKSEEERTKLIRTLSVMFNQMASEGEVEIIKEEGVKGNYYKWINK